MDSVCDSDVFDSDCDSDVSDFDCDSDWLWSLSFSSSSSSVVKSLRSCMSLVTVLTESSPLSISPLTLLKVLTTQATLWMMSPTTLAGLGNNPLFLDPVHGDFPGVGSPPRELKKFSASGIIPLMAETALSASDLDGLSVHA